MIFYWIALQTPSGVIDVRGPYNTQQGRDKQLIENNDFWDSAGVVAIPYETNGKKKANAYSMARQILEQSAAPQTDSNTPIDIQARQPTQMQEYHSEPQAHPVAVREASVDIGADVTLPTNEGIVQSAENIRSETLGEQETQMREVGREIFPESADDAIQREIADSDRFMEDVFAGTKSF